MIKLITLLLGALLVLGSYAQTEELSKSELKKMQKEQKKADRNAEDERLAEVTKLMVEEQKFVLEADAISDKSGNRVVVSPAINFVMIDSLSATLQFGSAFEIGINGLGGATVDGRLTKYNARPIGKAKDSYSISIMMITSMGNYDIIIMVSPNGSADASIKGNWSGQLNYHGKLVPLALSRVYKGHPTY